MKTINHNGTCYLNLAAWFDQWWIWWCYSSSVVASEDFYRGNFSVEWFCLICFNISTKQPISRFAFWKVIIFQRSFDWGFQWTMRYQFFCSAILLVRVWGCCWVWWKFCSSMAFRETLLDTVGLAGLGMDLMVLFFFCDFFWGMGMLKRPETIVMWRHWVGRSLRPGKPSNSPRWRGGRHDGAEGAISTEQFTCLHWALNEAICLSNKECTELLFIFRYLQ